MNDVITKIVTNADPIIPINFNSVPKEWTLTELTLFIEVGAMTDLFASSWFELFEIDSLEIIEFLNLSLDLNLFFFEFFFATFPLLIF